MPSMLPKAFGALASAPVFAPGRVRRRGTERGRTAIPRMARFDP